MPAYNTRGWLIDLKATALNMSGMDSKIDFSTVPLFPLPNVVLFPRAILPLHIFEDRYKEMVADALEGPRFIAMALLKSGWEKTYYGKPPIDQIVCVGQILTWEKLPDGKYNLLLQGRKRARLVRELPSDKPYRLAELEPLAESDTLEIDLDQERRVLMRIFSDSALASLPIAGQFRQLLSGPITTADIADLLAFNFLEDVDLKQQLLGQTDVRRRVTDVVQAIESCASKVNPVVRYPADPNAN